LYLEAAAQLQRRMRCDWNTSPSHLNFIKIVASGGVTGLRQALKDPNQLLVSSSTQPWIWRPTPRRSYRCFVAQSLTLFQYSSEFPMVREPGRRSAPVARLPLQAAPLEGGS
jgi:hypothetical protein